METFTPWEELTEKEQLLSYISDQYKSAYGFRPNLTKYRVMSEDLLRDELDHLSKKVEEQMEQEETREKEDVEKFKKLIQDTIELGAGDEETALRWLTEEERIFSIMDTEQYVWSQGILHTEYGKQVVVNKLNKIYNV